MFTERAASKMVVPSGTETGFLSMISFTICQLDLL